MADLSNVFLLGTILILDTPIVDNGRLINVNVYTLGLLLDCVIMVFSTSSLLHYMSRLGGKSIRNIWRIGKKKLEKRTRVNNTASGKTVFLLGTWDHVNALFFIGIFYGYCFAAVLFQLHSSSTNFNSLFILFVHVIR